MTDIKQHPTVRRFEAQTRPTPTTNTPLDAQWLRDLCLELGADDVGFVEIERPALDTQRTDIQALFPKTRTLISYVCRMNREPIRSTARSIANVEFHHTTDRTDAVGHAIVAALEARGIRALNPTTGFPMEVQNFPSKSWVVSHKPVAVAAGLGRMGIHRNVIHPKFGNFILLGTVLIEADVTATNQEIDYNPCLECKLCVAACPVGAIRADGGFDFVACLTHNYREFLGGFNDWVDTVVESKDSLDYAEKVSPAETTSMWQSLSFGANYKAAYCMAVCPAGADVIGPFLTDQRQFLQDVVRPLQEKVEMIYVLPGSAAETHVAKRFPHKHIRRVQNGARPKTIDTFLTRLPLAFRSDRAVGLECTYHFTFTGSSDATATITIRGGKLTVERGLSGTPDIHIHADARTWLQFIAEPKPTRMIPALLRRKVRIRGNARQLIAFGKCFAI